jgi:ATP adenylyltransferase
MDHIWSPWRMEYIMHNQPKGSDSCFFCEALEMKDSPENLIVHRGQRAFAILNRYPYTSGHLMVVPIAHEPSIEMLDALTNSEIMQMISQSMKVLKDLYGPEGYNLGANIGKSAGAGVLDHVHFHVVPRWAGDTNFMTTTSGARVLPEDLADTFTRVRDYWAKVFP